MTEPECLPVRPIASRPVEPHVLADGENVVFISAASGTGKQSVIDHIIASNPALWQFSVSCTTRQPRPGEIDGKHYHFMDLSRFEEIVDNDGFVEYNQVHGLAWYGTPLQPIHEAINSQKLVIGDADVEGIARMRKKLPKAAYFFLYAEPQELRNRILGRADMPEEELIVRLRKAEEEIAFAQETYDPAYIIESKTILDDAGKPTLDGVAVAASAVIDRLCQHAEHYWPYNMALHELYKRTGYIGGGVWSSRR